MDPLPSLEGLSHAEAVSVVLTGVAGPGAARSGAGSPFGPGVAALSTYLRYGHAISYQRLSRLLGEVLGVTISQGAVSNLLLEANERLEPRVREALSRSRVSELIASDETSTRVSGTTSWEWVFHNESVCVHVVRPSRGAAVIEEVMAGHRPRVWLSDLYSANGPSGAVL